MDFTQDQLMQLIYIAFGQGTGPTVSVSTSASEWLYDRYYVWLVTLKEPNKQTPLEAWDEWGDRFLGRFRLIGERAAGDATGGTVGSAEVVKAAMGVEQESDCPFCP